MVSSKVFNEHKSDYEKTPLFLGEDSGLFDTVNKQYPEIWEIYKTVKSLDWSEDEFDYGSCARDFQTCDKSTYDMMIKTLAWQWEADSVASRISPIVGSIVSSSELWAAWQRISDQEVIHAATYSEIVRNSFDDPSAIVNEILSVKESLGRLEHVGDELGRTYKVAHEYALGLREADQETYNSCFMFAVAMLILERISFMASFAVTFSICDTGMFQPIGKAVQKIAQDELETHVELDKAVLRVEMQTERGKVAFEQCKDRIQTLIDEVVQSEFEWVDYLFSEGRELIGMNADVLKSWTAFCAKDVYHFFGLKTEVCTLPKHNPLRFMENWLNISKTQASPQEEQNGQYKVGVLKRNDSGLEFDVDF
jgi:ribonucleoside-diphosphate reductase beta chain